MKHPHKPKGPDNLQFREPPNGIAVLIICTSILMLVMSGAWAMFSALSNM